MKVDFTPISKSLSSAKGINLFYFILFFDSTKAHSFFFLNFAAQTGE